MKDNDMIFDEFDRDLKKSLDAAFDMNDISVSEELIASTLSKINLIKDKTGETDPAEDDDKRRNVTDISGKAGFRRFARISGPIAAAVIIGLLGIALVKNNLIFSSKSDNSAPANYEANSAVSMKAADTDEDYRSGKVESESVSEMAGSDQAAYEPAASDDYAVYYGTPEISSFNGDFGKNMNTVKSTEEIDCQELCDDNKVDEGSADGSTKESKAEAPDAGNGSEPGISDSTAGMSDDAIYDNIDGSGEKAISDNNGGSSENGTGAGTGGTDYDRAGATPTDDIEEDGATEDEYREYCFAIPGDLAEEIAGIANRYAFGRIDASEYRTGELDIQNLKEKLQEADLQKNDDLSPDEDGSLQGEEDMSAVTAGYLVIRDGMFYFTDNESLEPEEGSSIYILETPGSSDDAMATEIEAIMK